MVVYVGTQSLGACEGLMTESTLEGLDASVGVRVSQKLLAARKVLLADVTEVAT